MRRRSALGTYGAVAPIRTSELFELNGSCQPTTTTRLSVIPRQLVFANTSQKVDTKKPEKHNVASGERSRISRFSTFGKAVNNTSVMDCSVLLSETVRELPEDANDDEVVEVSSQVCSTVPATNQPSSVTNQKSPSTNQKSSSTNQKSSCTYQKGSTTSQKSSASLTETAAPIAELNSTAAFEEDEIASLVATPHPDRNSRACSSVHDAGNSAIAEQMQRFISDQRNLMQVMKLSFQKMNGVMDQMSLFMGKMNSMLDTQCEPKLHQKNLDLSEKLPHGTPDSTDNDSDKVRESGNEVAGVSKALASTFIDNKENVHAHSKSFAAFRDMKSKLICLKTPTALRTRPLSAETPNTTLSNTICHQLEDLFENSSGTDE